MFHRKERELTKTSGGGMSGSSDHAQELDDQLRATREIAAIAEQVISRGFVQEDLSLVVAARSVVRLLFQTDFYNDPLFLPVLGFEDMTSELIVGPNRDKWAKEYLDRVDNRIADYLTQNGQSVIEDFEAIVGALPRFEAFFRDERARMDREAKSRGWERRRVPEDEPS